MNQDPLNTSPHGGIPRYATALTNAQSPHPIGWSPTFDTNTNGFLPHFNNGESTSPTAFLEPSTTPETDLRTMLNRINEAHALQVSDDQFKICKPSGPRKNGEGTEDEAQAVVHAAITPTGGARLTVTILAAGFCIGPEGASIQEICRVTGADIRSFTTKAPNGRCCREFVIEGSNSEVTYAIHIVNSAVKRYKKLCEGEYKGRFVRRDQHVAGVTFFYQPPPREAVPQAAKLLKDSGRRNPSKSSSTSNYTEISTTSNRNNNSPTNSNTVNGNGNGNSTAAANDKLLLQGRNAVFSPPTTMPMKNHPTSPPPPLTVAFKFAATGSSDFYNKNELLYNHHGVGGMPSAAGTAWYGNDTTDNNDMSVDNASPFGGIDTSLHRQQQFPYHQQQGGYNRSNTNMSRVNSAPVPGSNTTSNFLSFSDLHYGYDRQQHGIDFEAAAAYVNSFGSSGGVQQSGSGISEQQEQQLAVDAFLAGVQAAQQAQHVGFGVNNNENSAYQAGFCGPIPQLNFTSPTRSYSTPIPHTPLVPSHITPPTFFSRSPSLPNTTTPSHNTNTNNVVDNKFTSPVSYVNEFEGGGLTSAIAQSLLFSQQSPQHPYTPSTGNPFASTSPVAFNNNNNTVNNTITSEDTTTEYSEFSGYAGTVLTNNHHHSTDATLPGTHMVVDNPLVNNNINHMLQNGDNVNVNSGGLTQFLRRCHTLDGSIGSTKGSDVSRTGSLDTPLMLASVGSIPSSTAGMGFEERFGPVTNGVLSSHPGLVNVENGSGGDKDVSMNSIGWGQVESLLNGNGMGITTNQHTVMAAVTMNNEKTVSGMMSSMDHQHAMVEGMVLDMVE